VVSTKASVQHHTVTIDQNNTYTHSDKRFAKKDDERVSSDSDNSDELSFLKERRSLNA